MCKSPDDTGVRYKRAGTNHSKHTLPKLTYEHKFTGLRYSSTHTNSKALLSVGD